MRLAREFLERHGVPVPDEDAERKGGEASSEEAPARESTAPETVERKEGMPNG
jgi:hypothetical protein